MKTAELLMDGFERVRETAHEVLEGAPEGALTVRLDAEANTIAWLIWHLARVQDDHVADAFGAEQVWLTQGWAARFALPFDDDATGYGQSTDDVAAVAVSAELLTGYLDATHDATAALLSTITDDDLDRVVDTRWDPPVTLGVRLVSVISDSLQHAGQAALIRGVADRS